ncbi:hypothetical protein AB3464_25235 [Pseudomonas asplenii]|uniref:gp53-like domain-containing protein n=1 Tax=Pseudomonas asplenii TaxID=53407 RepID=UPI0037C79742
MQKIGDSTPTANGAGEFTRGQPGSGIDATVITPEWLNSIQREVIAVLVGAGIEVDPKDDGQLLAAINALAKGFADFSKLLNTPTTLTGYGITDAVRTLATVVKGKLSDVADSRFTTIADETVDRPAAVSYGAGLHIKYPGGKYAFDLLGSVTSEWFGVRRVDEAGAGPWRQLFHEGNFNPALLAALDSPKLKGLPTAPTPDKAVSTDQVATTAFVQAVVAAFSESVVTALANKAPVASPGFTGIPTAPTPAAGTSTNQIATASFVQQALLLLLPKRAYAANDFIRIPDVAGGLIIQFGSATVGPEASLDVSLPNAFNTIRGVIGGVGASGWSTNGNFSAYASVVSNGVIRLTQDVSTTSGAGNQTIYYIAWGN